MSFWPKGLRGSGGSTLQIAAVPRSFRIKSRGALRILLGLVIGCVVVGAGAGALWWWWSARPPARSECEQLVLSGDSKWDVGLCLAGYAFTGDEQELFWAAQAYLARSEFANAEVLARGLLPGPLGAEGHQILSVVMVNRELGDDARMHAFIAVWVHTFAGDEQALTRDYLSLAQAMWQVGDSTASLEAAEQALQLARGLDDRHKERAAHLARADALRRMGDTNEAAKALERAFPLAEKPCDVAWIRLKQGMCEMESDREVVAEVVAEQRMMEAEKANAECSSPVIKTSIALNRAWLLRRKDPRATAALLDEVERAGGERVETRLMHGYLAADRGALDEAEERLARAAAMAPPDADWPWLIELAQAELAERRGGPSGDRIAEDRYRRSIAMVTALRSSSRDREAQFVSSHRGPFDGLIGLLARRGRWRDVLDVVLELDASDMLRAYAPEPVGSGSGSAGFGPPLKDSAARPPPRPPSVDEILAAWRGRDLVIVIARSRHRIDPGHHRVYRLRVRDGEVTGQDVGDAGVAQRWAKDLSAIPGDRAAARGLGAMFVPAEPSSELLHVLSIGTLGQVPLAALRDAYGLQAVARRPMGRVLALHASGPEAPGMSRAVVIADPRGDLPWAVEEGRSVVEALGGRAQLSGAKTGVRATRERLWDARDAELLHVAAHVSASGQRRALRLADGDVDPAEMLRARLAPRLAVLASCGSAAASDEEGWGSIATALLEAGTVAVVATDRSVNDAASLQILRAFYKQPDWRAAPARALARVQRDLDTRVIDAAAAPATNPQNWAAFSVLLRPPHISCAPAAGQTP